MAGLWGSELLWDQFLAERTRQGAEVKLASPSAVVMHGEYECCFVHGEVPGVGHQPFVESRWSALPYPAAPGSEVDANHAAYFTDLSEGDAIQGRGRARLEGILDELAGESDRFALCHFNATCVPTVLHDDSTGLLARFRERSALPVYHVTEERPSATASLVPLLRQRLARAGPADDWERPAAVNLVGYAAFVRSDVSTEAIVKEQEGLKAEAEAEAKRLRDQADWFSQGEGHLDNRDWSDALVAFKKARELGMDSLELSFNLGFSFQRTGDVASAIGEYRKILKIDPRDTDVRYNLARIYEKQKSWDEAIKEYQAILKFNPDDQGARQRLELLRAAREMIEG